MHWKRQRGLGPAGLVVAVTAALAATSTGLASSDTPRLEQVLARTAAYVADFERQLSGIVADEDYTQQVRGGKVAVPEELRRLRSDLLLVKPAGSQDWMQFRDVYEVNGVPVHDRNDRLMKLFIDPGESVNERLRGIIRESARFNIGSIDRTMNVPLLPLRFLEQKNQWRFKFKRSSDTKPGDGVVLSPPDAGRFRISTEVWTIQYQEREPGTMVRTTRLRDIFARGRFWIDPADGKVLMSEMILENGSVRGTMLVNFQSEPIVGLLVPIEMRERYDKTRDGSVIDGFATYGKFRQFKVLVDEKLGPIKQ
jgi:hypothetical protein